MSLAKNTTGFYRVHKHKAPTCKQGFEWIYLYYDNGKHKRIHSVDLRKLKEKVIARGLEWCVIDEENAKMTCEKYGYDYEDLI